MAARPRKPWVDRAPAQQKRLLAHFEKQNGWTEAQTIAHVEGGGELTAARGHGTREREQMHAHQRYLTGKYGPMDLRGDPEITPQMLIDARRQYGDEWLTQRLEKMAHDYRTSARGKYPHAGDDEYRRKSDRILYEAGSNPFAPLFWYHGKFG
ncbi:hypothetical protein FRACA_1920006 [Frankia canadensis]|uniref:Uncharacterized protein n=1 Tax=Frankia canadensis TaxID=1836972 RepID=A0A2I2KPC7_9ACTN|nr:MULTISPECIES: hypothetical protein [Frankia]SNQ47510.1 hypothetical protein FRACA_1920006 [Frankia canadensis]SOU54800.1 hypothetical protein FRACA_1920006 [Frankia canadensis]